MAEIVTKATGPKTGLDRFRTSGSMKALFPRSAAPGIEAIVINTAGGLTGGDRFDITATAGAGTQLSLTTQAAERAYRATGGTARVRTTLTVATGATLHWLPQELILYDGSALDRTLTCDLARDGRLLLVEPVLFGRTAMGERVQAARFTDFIDIRRNGAPLYADRLHLDGDLDARLAEPALAAGARAMASLVYVAPDAEARREAIRPLLPETGGASLLGPDMLVARLLAADGFGLRHTLVPILRALRGADLPRSWSL